MRVQKVVINGIEYVATDHGPSGKKPSGEGSTGHGSTGDFSTGNGSTGDFSTGHGSTGSGSTGDFSTGNRSTGYYSTGDCSTGYSSTGNRSTGNRSTGDYSTGYGSTGYKSTGNRSTGQGSTGDWSTGDFSTGHFCTKDHQGFGAFNKPIKSDNDSDAISIWNAAEKPDCLYFELTKWVFSDDMTEDELENNPKHKVCDGYLKVFDYKQAFTSAVTSVRKKDRDMIRALPNFDDDIFLEISGCDMRLLGD